MRKMIAHKLQTKRKSESGPGSGLRVKLKAPILVMIASLPVLSASVGLGLGLLGTQMSYAAAAKAAERVVDGKVLDKTDGPIAGAVVFIKDTHSQAIRTYICDQEARFHFGQLAQSTDYEIWAESNGVRSHSKSISSFDSKNEYNFTLKVNAAK